MLPVPLPFEEAEEEEHTAGDDSATVIVVVSPEKELVPFMPLLLLCFCMQFPPPPPPPPIPLLLDLDPWWNSYGSSELCSMLKGGKTTEEELLSLISLSLSPTPISEDMLLALF